MKRTARFLLVTLLVPVLLAPACRKADDDRPRRGPGAAAAPRVAAAAPQGTDDPDEGPPPDDPGAPGGPGEPPPGAPPGTPGGPAPGGPAPGGPAPGGPGGGAPRLGIPFTPFQIPWPLPNPGSLPRIPGMPALPGIPGFPGGVPGMPGGRPTPGTVPPQGEAKVVMYGASWCPACKQLKADLAARRIPYSYVDVEDPKQQQPGAEIPANQRGGIPITRVTQRNGQVVWVKGADAARIEQAYKS